MELYIRAGFSLLAQTSFFLICAGDSMGAGYHPRIMPRPEVLYLLKCKVCGEAPYVAKVKTKFQPKFNKHRANIELSGMETKKCPRNIFRIIIVWMVI